MVADKRPSMQCCTHLYHGLPRIPDKVPQSADVRCARSQQGATILNTLRSLSRIVVASLP